MFKDRTLEDKVTSFVNFFDAPTEEELVAFGRYLKRSVGLPLTKVLNKNEFLMLYRFSNEQEKKNILCKECTLKTKNENERIK